MLNREARAVNRAGSGLPLGAELPPVAPRAVDNYLVVNSEPRRPATLVLPRDTAALEGHGPKDARRGHYYDSPSRRLMSRSARLGERVRNHLAEEREVALQVGVRPLDDEDLERDQLVGVQVEGGGEGD